MCVRRGRWGDAGPPFWEWRKDEVEALARSAVTDAAVFGCGDDVCDDDGSSPALMARRWRGQALTMTQEGPFAGSEGDGGCDGWRREVSSPRLGRPRDAAKAKAQGSEKRAVASTSSVHYLDTVKDVRQLQ